MIEEIPPFWWRKAGWQAAVLWPASLVVGRLAARRLRSRRRESFDLPVLCVAALAVGAAGRTEVAMALARAAALAGRRPGLIASGPSGAFASPHQVDTHHDLPRHVGDEALQLARAAPTVLCADRVAAARVLAAEGRDIVIIADGQVGERIAADLTLLVADAARGIGNGYVVPAGPVRAPLVDQFRQVDAVLRLGDGEGADRLVRLGARAARPVYEAAVVPAGAGKLKGRRLLAFAGTIAPGQFFAMVRAAGGGIEVERVFADGHLYADDELQELSDTAAKSDLAIVTTARDAARLAHGSPAAEDLRRRLIVMDTEVAFDLAHVPGTIVGDAVEKWRRRQHA
jgi:tetraacyldisaccharide 4'-kinase